MVLRFAISARYLPRPILALVALAGIGTGARAQLYTTDPYDPYGRYVRNYVYPGGGDGFAANVAARSRNYVAPNQFDRYSDDLDSPFGGGRGTRYDDAYRRYDEVFERDYVPNRNVDEKYRNDRDRREGEMIQAMREPDAKKRDKLIREIEQRAKRSASELSLSVRRGNGDAVAPNASGRRPAQAPVGITRASDPGDPTIPMNPGRRARPGATRGTNSAAPARSTSSAPAAPSATSGRSPSTAGGRGREDSSSAPSPSDVLNRSREMSRERETIPPAPR